MSQDNQNQTPGLDDSGPLQTINQQEFQEQATRPEGAEKVMGVLAGAMPWVISLLFHVGLFLVMVFLVFVVLKTKPSEGLIIPDAVLSENPGGRMTQSPSQTMSKAKTSQSKRKSFVKKQSVTDMGKTEKPVDVIGRTAGGGSSGASKMGMQTASGGGPKSTFFGSGGNAYNVVYVVDRSGSMIDTFSDVKNEMARSIGRLRPTQMFHVILFAEGRPVENPPRKLVPASPRNKKEVAVFLQSPDVIPEGSTYAIPALQRAFDVLRGARKQGKLVYLLTDGNFRDPGGNDAVLAALNQMNTGTTSRQRVHVNTFLYGTKPPSAVEVMTKIAQQNGGRYTFVEYER